MPVRRKLFADEGCSKWADREIIVISDDEDDVALTAGTDEAVYRDIHEVPRTVTPIPAPGLDDDEYSEEDPDEEWDEEAAAYDAALLHAEDQEMADLEEDFIPIEDTYEPEHDSAWDEPTPSLNDIPEEDVEMDGVIGDLPHPLYDFNAEMIVGLVQTAVAEAAAAEIQEAEDEVYATHQAMEIQTQMHVEEVTAMQDQLEAEQRRTASLTTSLEVARIVAESTEERMGRLRAAVAASFRDLAQMVDQFNDFSGMHTPFIAKEVVQGMIDSVSAHILGRP